MNTDGHGLGDDANFANWREFLLGKLLVILIAGFLILLFGSSCKIGNSDNCAITCGDGAVSGIVDTFTNADLASNQHARAYPITDADRSFLNEIKNAVAANDIV